MRLSSCVQSDDCDKLISCVILLSSNKCYICSFVKIVDFLSIFREPCKCNLLIWRESWSVPRRCRHLANIFSLYFVIFVACSIVSVHSVGIMASMSASFEPFLTKTSV